jgi:hypothetical protein
MVPFLPTTKVGGIYDIVWRDLSEPSQHVKPFIPEKAAHFSLHCVTYDIRSFLL